MRARLTLVLSGLQLSRRACEACLDETNQLVKVRCGVDTTVAKQACGLGSAQAQVHFDTPPPRIVKGYFAHFPRTRLRHNGHRIVLNNQNSSRPALRSGQPSQWQVAYV